MISLRFKIITVISHLNILLGDIEEDTCRAGEGPEGLPREPEAGGEAAQAESLCPDAGK